MTEIEKARELFVSCRLKEAKPLLEELAGAGDSDALYMLAMMTYDVDIAIELLAKSAAKGNAGAKLMRLALMADASQARRKSRARRRVGFRKRLVQHRCFDGRK